MQTQRWPNLLQRSPSVKSQQSLPAYHGLRNVHRYEEKKKGIAQNGSKQGGAGTFWHIINTYTTKIRSTVYVVYVQRRTGPSTRALGSLNKNKTHKKETSETKVPRCHHAKKTAALRSAANLTRKKKRERNKMRNTTTISKQQQK